MMTIDMKSSEKSGLFGNLGFQNGEKFYLSQWLGEKPLDRSEAWCSESNPLSFKSEFWFWKKLLKFKQENYGRDLTLLKYFQRKDSFPGLKKIFQVLFSCLESWKLRSSGKSKNLYYSRVTRNWTGNIRFFFIKLMYQREKKIN